MTSDSQRSGFKGGIRKALEDLVWRHAVAMLLLLLALVSCGPAAITAAASGGGGGGSGDGNVNRPSVAFVDIKASPSSSRTILISYMLTDPESDPADIAVSYSIDGRRTFNTATEATSVSASEGTQELSTSPSGVVHLFAWDSEADNVTQMDLDSATLRLTPLDSVGAGVPVEKEVDRGSTVALAFPPPVSLTDAATILVRGSAYDPDGVAVVWVDGKPASTNDGFQTWQVRVPLMAGRNTLKVDVRDGLGFFKPQAAQAQVESKVLLGRPFSVAVHPRANRVLVIDSGRIVEMGTQQFTLISGAGKGKGPLFLAPSAIAWDGDRALVVDGFVGRARVLAVDLRSGSTLGDRTVLSDAKTGKGGGFSDPRGIVVDSSGGRALVVDSGLDAVIAVDLKTGDRTVLSDANTGKGGTFSDPRDIAMNGSRALVVDAGLDAVVAVDLRTGDRTLLSTGKGQLTKTMFSDPRGIAVHTSSLPVVARALVVDAGLAAVVAVDLKTGTRTVLSANDKTKGKPLESPSGVAVQTTGTLKPTTRGLVVDPGADAVVAVDLQGGTQEGNRTVLAESTVGTGSRLAAPVGIATAGSRALVVDRFSAKGSVIRAVVAVDLKTGDRTPVSDKDNGTGTLLDIPTGIAIDGSRSRALVVDAGLKAVVEVDLRSGEPFGDRAVMSDANTGKGGPLSDPRGIALDGDRALVVDAGLKAVVAVDLGNGDRKVLSDASTGMGTGFSDPRGITVDGSRALVVDAGLKAVVAVDLESGNRQVLSDASTGMGTGFSDPRGITVDGNRALVADAGLRAVVSVDLQAGATYGDRTVLTGMGPALRDPQGVALNGGGVLVVDASLVAVVAVDVQTGERGILSK